MKDWQSTYLGRGALPRDLSGFEIETFFAYSESERHLIDDERRTPALKLALALQIGFLRMTGRSAGGRINPGREKRKRGRMRRQLTDLRRC